MLFLSIILAPGHKGDVLFGCKIIIFIGKAVLEKEYIQMSVLDIFFNSCSNVERKGQQATIFGQGTSHIMLSSV